MSMLQRTPKLSKNRRVLEPDDVEILSGNQEYWATWATQRRTVRLEREREAARRRSVRIGVYSAGAITLSALLGYVFYMSELIR